MIWWGSMRDLLGDLLTAVLAVRPRGLEHDRSVWLAEPPTAKDSLRDRTTVTQ